MTTANALVVTAEPGVPFVDSVREVDAPVADVFRAYTDPDLVVQWLGPRELAMDLSSWDARIGGTWAYTSRDPAGNSYGFRGVFHDVDPGRGIVQTFEYDGFPGHVSLDSVVFEDLGERTRIRNHTTFQSQEDRDGMVASGMERGMAEGFERLEELLAAK
ncbi:SRPBCC family protein [Arthrobacter sp. STN4]|uniref:SRPBCC family protein n=1 Tax=Arthrobacter sp. STN4 TaxID=2923276 RepID=UPI00211A663A|nr:SRPBCC family protein [Arthrobacter sp. STN4]MCQ9165319.1 SRPBCC family protein [Arthrobacter sp. STN4]